MASTSNHDTLIDMGAVIDELRKPNGWQKGQYGSYAEPDGPCCLVGAMARVSGKPPAFVEDWLDRDGTVLNLIQRRFPNRVDTKYPSVVDFNDDEDTTLDDVILVCEKARAAQGEVSA